jgi:hypothetical protein
MKRKRSPRRRVNRIVVNSVNELEYRGLMHPAVRPIEIGLVQKKGNENTREKISPSILGNIQIDLRVTRFPRPEKEDSGERKNDATHNRPFDFRSDDFKVWSAWVDLPRSPLLTVENPKIEVSSPRKSDVSERDYEKKPKKGDRHLGSHFVWFLAYHNPAI